jgi:plasmid stabilization system protein ParE
VIIEFTAYVVHQIEDTVRFISVDKPGAARKWAKSVKRSVMKLTEFPYIGRIAPEFADENIHELLSPFTTQSD